MKGKWEYGVLTEKTRTLGVYCFCFFLHLHILYFKVLFV